jgi:hypothetical protein
MRTEEVDEIPTPIDHWIFYAEKLPLKEGWYETKDSALEKRELYHAGDGKQNVWYTQGNLVEKFTGFISYWRPIKKDKLVFNEQIIYHPSYGFGVMKDLPTFGSLQVKGIRNQCISAYEALKLYAKDECSNYFKFLFKTEVSDDSLYQSYLNSKTKL